MSSLAMILESYLKQTNTFIRFLFVGAINTVIGLSSMLVLFNAIGLSYWLATFLGNCIGATVSYFLNRSFTFQSQINMKASIPRFIIVIVACYFFSYSVSYLTINIVTEIKLIENTHQAENFAIMIGTVFYTVSNYLGQRYFVFYKGPTLQ